MPSMMTRQSWEPGRSLGVRGKVLLVDANPRDLNYYRQVLEAEGFEVCAQTSCAEGLKRLEQGAFDFVLVDQGSPAFESRALLERAVEIDRHLPVVVLTRCLNMNCYLDAMQLGAVDYVEKPLAPAEALHLAEAHLRRHNVAA